MNYGVLRDKGKVKKTERKWLGNRRSVEKNKERHDVDEQE